MNALVNLKTYIEEMIAHMKRPRLMCICGDFTATGKMDMDWHKCRCGGWISSMALHESRRVS